MCLKWKFIDRSRLKSSENALCIRIHGTVLISEFLAWSTAFFAWWGVVWSHFPRDFNNQHSGSAWNARISVERHWLSFWVCEIAHVNFFLFTYRIAYNLVLRKFPIHCASNLEFGCLRIVRMLFIKYPRVRKSVDLKAVSRVKLQDDFVKSSQIKP